MSQLKISPELFVESQELNHLVSFLETDGYKLLFQNQAETFGLIENYYFQYGNQSFDNFKTVVSGVSNSVDIGVGIAIDKQLRIIRYQGSTLAIPNDSQWYWIRVKYKASPQENGIVSLDTSGNMTGVGTSFTSVLRGQPNFPSRVRFERKDGGTGLLNTQEYEVVQITSDTAVVLAGNFQAETDLKYINVGTFTPGVLIPTLSKDIFQYDSCELTLLQETILNTPPYQGGDLIDESFFIYRIRNVSGSIQIQDKRERTQSGRRQIFQMKGAFLAKELNRTQNPLIGVEKIRFGAPLTTKDLNLVTIGWGFRSTDWSIDTTVNKVIINSGNGGTYTSINDVITGDFDNWKIYNQTNDTYHTIVRSTKETSSVQLILDTLNIDNFPAGSLLTIVPNAEEIEFLVTPASTTYNTLGQALQAERYFTLPIKNGIGSIELPVFQDPTYYNINYRYKQLRDYSQEYSLTSGSFYGEENFDDYGAQTSFILTAYTNAVIPLKLSPTSYSRIINEIFIGDLKGISYYDLTSPTSGMGSKVYNLQVASNTEYLIVRGTDVVFDDNIVVNLKTLNAQNGNRFYIQVDAGIAAASSTIKSLQFRQDYINAGSPGISLVELGVDFESILNYLNDSGDPGWITFIFTFDGSRWKVTWFNPIFYRYAINKIPALENRAAALESRVGGTESSINTINGAWSAYNAIVTLETGTGQIVTSPTIVYYKNIGKTLILSLPNVAFNDGSTAGNVTISTTLPPSFVLSNTSLHIGSAVLENSTTGNEIRPATLTANNALSNTKVYFFFTDISGSGDDWILHGQITCEIN